MKENGVRGGFSSFREKTISCGGTNERKKIHFLTWLR
jgi:hypothetical protein